MKRYVIERDIPKVGSLSREEYRGLAATSNAALAKLAGKVQWLRSHIAADKTFCIYLAESEALVREHSRIAGFPVTKVTEVLIEIGPMSRRRALSPGAATCCANLRHSAAYRR